LQDVKTNAPIIEAIKIVFFILLFFKIVISYYYCCQHNLN